MKQVGEFVAFVIGWNLTLEHVIGTASLARGYSGYLGSLFAEAPPVVAAAAGNLTSSVVGVAAHQPIDWLPEFLQGYVTHFDSLAFFLTMLVTGLLLLGVQVSSKFQITFATINLSVACFIFICGLFKADFHNWNLKPEEIPASAGAGGFLPFGFSGVVAGAGTCFFAFVGFDGIAATAEEVKNPRKAIPNSILWTSGIIFVTYCCMATIQTLIWPYWDQKQAAPLPYIFDKLDMHFAKWTVLVGVLAGLSTSFVGGFLPLPRILYAMARDGVIYRVLAVVSKRFKVPIVATIIGGILIACLASLLEIDQLADMLSIGTLAAYSLVSISVLLLRYEYRKPTNCENPLPITYKDCNTNTVANLTAMANDKTPTVTTNGESKRPSGEHMMENLALVAAANGALALDDAKKNEARTPDVNGNRRLSATSSSASSGLGGRSANGSGASTSGCSSSGGAPTSSAVSELGADSSCSITGSSTSSRSLLSLFLDGTKGPGPNETRRPDEQTTHISRVMILILVVVTTALDFALVVWGQTLYMLEPVALSICSLLFALTLFLGFLLNRLPVAEPSTNSFEVPMVPTIPLFSVIINTYLMLNLSGKFIIMIRVSLYSSFYSQIPNLLIHLHSPTQPAVMTWIRFAVWMAIGFFIYFTYGIFKSTGYRDSRCD